MINKKKLDLHGMSTEEASEKFRSFITEKFYNFEDECLIITGRGNHVNANGNYAIIYNELKKWTKEPGLQPFIKRYIPKQGSYKILLYSSKKKVLNGEISDSIVGDVIKDILEEYKIGNNRIIITHQQYQTQDYYNKLSVLVIMNLLQYPFIISVEVTDQSNAMHLLWQTNRDNFLTQKMKNSQIFAGCANN